MLTITTTEFKNNFGKYVELGQKEIIEVTKQGKVIFKILPRRLELLEEAKKYLDFLPADATIGVDPDERG